MKKVLLLLITVLTFGLEGVLILAPEFSESVLKCAVEVLTKGETNLHKNECTEEELRDLLQLLGIENVSLEQSRTEEPIVVEVEEEINETSKKKKEKIRVFLKKNRKKHIKQPERPTKGIFIAQLIIDC